MQAIGRSDVSTSYRGWLVLVTGVLVIAIATWIAGVATRPTRQ